MAKKESPEDNVRRLYGELELAFSVAGVKAVRGPHPLGALADLLAPVVILQQTGTSGELCQQIDTVKAAAIINHDLPGNPTKEREENAQRFNILAGRLLWHLEAAYEAEKKLALEGWEFDPKKRIVKSKMVKGQPGNRPQKFLLRCIEAASENFPDLKGEPLRKAVAKMLLLYFPPGVLETGPHGNIDNTLGNYRKK